LGCLERNDASRQPTSGSRRTRVSSDCMKREGSSSRGGTRDAPALSCGNEPAVGGRWQLGPEMARILVSGTRSGPSPGVQQFSADSPEHRESPGIPVAGDGFSIAVNRRRRDSAVEGGNGCGRGV
jgi:hypothetical protein